MGESRVTPSSATDFDAGDEVALSATFIRSVGRNHSFGGGSFGATTDDKGVGRIIGFDPGLPDIAFVQWGFRGPAHPINRFNLVHRKNIHLDAHRAETAGIGLRLPPGDEK